MSADSTASTIVSYTIDASDIITEVSPSWDGFARENFAVRLGRSDVVGRPLWDFIHDESTMRLYQVLLKTVREKKKKLTIPYRCDSPRVRRYMVMEVTPNDDGSVSFVNELQEIRSRSPEVYFQHKLGASNTYYVMCSMCNKVRPWESETWNEVEDAFAALAQVDGPVEVVYEVCDPCSHTVDCALDGS